MHQDRALDVVGVRQGRLRGDGLVAGADGSLVFLGVVEDDADVVIGLARVIGERCALVEGRDGVLVLLQLEIGVAFVGVHGAHGVFRACGIGGIRRRERQGLLIGLGGLRELALVVLGIPQVLGVVPAGRVHGYELLERGFGPRPILIGLGQAHLGDERVLRRGLGVLGLDGLQVGGALGRRRGARARGRAHVRISRGRQKEKTRNQLADAHLPTSYDMFLM